MKLSNKILLGGFLSLIAIVILFIIFMSIRPSKREVTSFDYDNSSKLEGLNLLEDGFSDFSNVNISGAWDVEIRQGNDYQVEYFGREFILNEITSRISNNTLDISGSKDIPLDLDENNTKLKITLPNLKRLNFKGAGEIDIEGFNEEHFSVSIEGLINIVARDSNFDSLRLILEGMGNADFSNTISKELHIKSSMMGNLEFGVDNTKVTGNVDGMGAVTFHGTIRENDLNTSGMVEVSNK